MCGRSLALLNLMLTDSNEDSSAIARTKRREAGEERKARSFHDTSQRALIKGSIHMPTPPLHARLICSRSTHNWLLSPVLSCRTVPGKRLQQVFKSKEKSQLGTFGGVRPPPRHLFLTLQAYSLHQGSHACWKALKT